MKEADFTNLTEGEEGRGKYQTSIQTSLRVLKVLAENRECVQYYLPELIGKDYHTCLRHIQALEKDGLIRLVRVEPAQKGGKDKKIYTLTLYGLLVALSAFRQDFITGTDSEQRVNPKIDKIIDVWRDYHAILKNWQALAAHSRIDLYQVLYGTAHAFFDFWRTSTLGLLMWQLKTNDIGVCFARVFFDTFLDVAKQAMELEGDEEILNEWVVAIKNNEELKKLYIEIFNQTIHAKEQEIAFFKNIVEKLNK